MRPFGPRLWRNRTRVKATTTAETTAKTTTAVATTDSNGGAACDDDGGEDGGGDEGGHLDSGICDNGDEANATVTAAAATTDSNGGAAWSFEARKSLAWSVATLPPFSGDGIEPLNDIGQLVAACDLVGDVFVVGIDSGVPYDDGKFDHVKLIIVGDEGALDFTKLGDDACYAIKDYMDIMPICMDDDGPWTDDELAKVLDFWNCVTAIQPKLSLGCLFPGLQESSG